MKSINKQSGAVLVVSLIILLLLTMLGINSMQSTVMQEKMAGNSNDYNRAMQASEVALRVGETWVEDLDSKPVSASAPSSSQVWALNAPADVTTSMWWDHRVKGWWYSDSVQYTESLEDIPINPYYIVEELSFVEDTITEGMPSDTSGRSVYRITSRGIGGNENTVVLLQSIYSRRF